MNPRTKADFTKQFLENIEGSYRKFLGQELQELITANSNMVGGAGYFHDSLSFFVLDDGSPSVTSLQYTPGGVTPPQLASILVPKHEEWLGHYRLHEQELPRLTQILGSVLARAESAQDLRDMFPDYLVQPLLQHNAIAGLLRKRPDLYAGDPTKPTYALERALRAAEWDGKMLELYESIGPLVDRYMGFKFL